MLSKIESAVDSAAALLQKMQRAPLTSTRKEFNDIVTVADLAAEALLVEQLLHLDPSASVLAEEGFSTADDRRPRWIIDPLDGTVNYARGLPWYGVSVAYEDTHGVALGLLNAPTAGLKTCYVRGSLATVNGVSARVTETGSLEDAVVSICLTSHFSDADVRRTMSVIEGLALTTRGVRVIVSGALETALVAAGRLDAFISLKSDIVSHAATLPLVRAAGGSVTKVDGSDASLDDVEKIASNGRIHGALLDCVRSAIGAAN